MQKIVCPWWIMNRRTRLVTTIKILPILLSMEFVNKSSQIFKRNYHLNPKTLPKTNSRNFLMRVLIYLFLLTFRFPNRQPENNLILVITCFKVQMMRKINGFNRKGRQQKLLLRMDMVCRLFVTICQICKFLLYFRDGGGYNRAITTIIRESYKKIEDFLLKQCNIKIHSLTSSQFSLVKTPLVHCRNILCD